MRVGQCLPPQAFSASVGPHLHMMHSATVRTAEDDGEPVELPQISNVLRCPVRVHGSAERHLQGLTLTYRKVLCSQRRAIEVSMIVLRTISALRYSAKHPLSWLSTRSEKSD